MQKMGVRFIIIFYLLFVVCRDANGARNVLKQERKEENASYITSYGSTQERKEEDATYITSYGSTQERKEEDAPYITSYGSTREHKEEDASYITSYGSTRERKEENAPYITGYGSTRERKEEDAPYITSYGSTREHKEEDALYITSYGSTQERKEEDASYITSYGSTRERKEEDATYITSYGSTREHKEEDAPYITSYGSTRERKEEDAPYITNYGSTRERKEEDAPYITSYGSTREHKEEDASYITSYGSTQERKEEDAPYITSYGSTREHKEEDAPYITSYGSTRERKEEDAPYITSYGSTPGTKSTENVEVPYITQYGDKKASRINRYGTEEDNSKVEQTYQTGYKTTREVEAPYITGYISAQSTKKCEHHQKHVNPPSQNVDSGKDSHMGHDQHHDHMHAHSSFPMDHTEALKQGFFTFEDFYKGNSLPLNFPKQEHSRFLPKETADSIPFSTSQLPHLLQLFSFPHDCRDAKHMAWTLDQCELKPIKGETKFCATSLESMTDFVQKIIGSGVSFNILSTIHPETSTAITQKYTILDEPKQVLASKMVFCHPVPYPYAVFFCHHFENDTKFFKVSLGGENGDKVEAVAVCHMDTSDWDPNHDLFRLLGIKAGASSPVCHFFPANHLVWIPSSPTAAAF